ncbi:23S rRNA (uracil(1939)-C(5))-methyltransferase RlmD [Lacticigenium naphthae]|uniref:23S rRNA (uracil(1939)-C(5))-methyltransferase RlmD n=1 Tax=Lacticigenium naphthae TaxID=515351 RepID=UPI0004064094|nr:23S rRNA (uracil(1939)-C(5))-methyltransferase RlmD [Lacticigenium naphthae]
MNNTILPVEKNEDYKGNVIDLTHEGLGVVKIDNYPIFIQGALPEEVVTFKVVKVGKSFAFGKLITTHKKSPHRVESADPIYFQTGTMPLQHLEYSEQLKFKQKQVQNILEKTAELPGELVEETLGMKNPLGYRNKAQVPVRKMKDKLETGFYRRNSHELIPMEDFKIQDPKIDEAIIIIRDILRQHGVKPYDEKRNIGNIKNIMVRRGYHTGEMMIVLVTRTAKLFPLSKILPAILEALPEVVSIIQNVNPKRTNKILGEQAIILHGEDSYTDHLMGFKFKISHRSFYQVNPAQAEVLYQKVLDYAGLTGGETVIDAYCGIGTISLSLAKKAKHVYGIEIVAEAIEDAKKNAELNEVENVTYQKGSAEEVMLEWSKEGKSADLVVVDPPRKGLDPQFIESTLALKPEKFIYVSCNPATLARDLKYLVEGGYTVEKVQPVDMFPQTTHVETVVLMSRVEK